LFDLPHTADGNLIEGWLTRFSTLLGPRERPLPIILTIDAAAREPLFQTLGTNLALEVIRDTDATRGTAGVLRDVSRGCPDEEAVLVVTASDLGWVSNEAEAQALLGRNDDVVVSTDRDLRPAGPMRVRSGLLKRVPSVGFFDLKEQFLPRCHGAATFYVNRSERRSHGSLRDLRSYLSLVSEQRPGEPDQAATSAEPWQPGRALVEQGAQVNRSAILFESVILAGASVEEGAVVVRSLIGPGAVIRRGAEIVDKVIVGADGERGNREIDW
jgi:hypothetical protein